MCYSAKMLNNFGKISKRLKILFLPCKENEFRAKLLGSDFLFCLMLTLFAFRVIFLPFYFYFPKSIFFAKIISSEITNLLNQGRSDLGLNELIWNTELAYAAELKAQDMLENDYFSHTSPSGKKGWSFIDKAGYNYEIAGENLAIGFLDSSEVHEAWNESPSHKENLVNPRFKEVGIAVITGDFEGRSTTVVVQFFGAPRPMLPLAQTETLQTPTLPPPIPPALISEPESETKIPLTQPKIQEEVPETAGAVNQQESVPVSLLASLEFNFWNFFVLQYGKLVEKAILVTAGALIFVLCLNVLIVFLQPIENELKWTMIKNTIPVSAFSALALIFIASIEKSVFLSVISHNIKIQ